MVIVKPPSKIPMVLVVIVILAAVSAVGYFLYKNIIPKQPVLQQNGEEQPIEIKEAPLVEEKINEKYYIVDVSYPASLAEIKSYVDKAKSDLINIIPTNDADAEYQGLGPGREYSITITTRVVRSPKTITYILENYTYTGGAHGGTDIETFTYGSDVKIIQLKDTLVSTESLSKLSGMAREYFYRKIGDNSSKEMIDQGTAPNEENWNRWYLDDSGIVFIFGQYAIGAYVLGIQEFPLSYNEVREILNI